MSAAAKALVVREAEYAQFLRVWFCTAGDDELLEVRPLHKRRGNPARPQSWHRNASTAERAVIDAVRNGDDVYVGVLPRMRERGTEDAVGGRRWVWADIDYGTIGHAKPAFYATKQDALDGLKRVSDELGAKPTFIVDSGGGLHAWWALQEPASDTEWREAIDRLNHAVNGDVCATDLARILRVPGTKNYKVDPPRAVRLLEVSECWTEIDRFLALPPLPEESAAPVLLKRERVAGVEGPFDRANDVPVAEVLLWLGVPMHREGKRIYCACPVCPGSDEGEMVVGGRSNVASCFGDCADRGKGRSYSPVDLVAAVKAVEPRVAVELLAAQFRFDAFATPKVSDEWEMFVPLDEPPRPRFPQGVLDGVFGRFVDELATETQTPRDLAAMLTLAALSTACARKFVVHPEGNYCEPVNLFVAVSLPPGSRKTAVFRVVIEPFAEAEREDAARRKEEQALALELSKSSENDDATGKKTGKKNGKKDSNEAEEKAPPLRLSVDDASPEAVSARLCEQGGSLAVLSAEGGGLFDMMAGRYAGERGAAIEVYLKGHAGDDLKVDRIGRAGELVVRPALTVGIATQPDTLRTLAARRELRGRGLVARFLFGIPASNIGFRTIGATPMEPRTRTEYKRLTRRLLAIKLKGDSVLDPWPYRLTLDESAHALYRETATRYEERQRPDGDLAMMPEWSSKLLGAALRIAGLLHLADHADDDEPWNIPIAENTLHRAIHLADEYLVPHARLAFSIMTDTEAVDTARRLLAWINKNSVLEFSVRDAHRALGGKGARDETVDPALEVLMNHGYVRSPEAIASEGRSKAGRPRGLKYLVHPKL